MLILKIIFGVIFCFAGIMHLVRPIIFKQFIPTILPKKLVNYIVGIIEITLGLGLFFSSTTKNAALGIFILMILFLPIHIWDAAKEKPAIGSKKIAFVRIPLQFLLMYLSCLIYLNS